MRAARMLIACLCGLFAGPHLGAAELEPWFSETPDTLPGSMTEYGTLLGDAGGLRPFLSGHGISAAISTTQFYQGLASGGLEQAFEYGGRNDYFLKIASSPGKFHEGLVIALHGENRYGQDVNSITGDVSVPNSSMLFPLPEGNNSALTNLTFTYYLNEQIAVYAGKVNTLDGYFHPFAAGNGNSQFMNLSLIFPIIFSRTVPYSALGAGFIAYRDVDPVFSFMVIDPGGQPNRSGFDDAFSDGVSLASMMALPYSIGNLKGHHRVQGSWSNRSDNLLTNSNYLQPFPAATAGVAVPQMHNSWALHYSFDQYLYVDPNDPHRGWGVFLQASLSDGNPNPVRSYFSAGLAGKGLIEGRPDDTFGAGWYWFQSSTALRQATASTVPIGNETGVEMYYNAALTPWFHLTPNLQVLEPAQQSANTALVIGLRAHLDF